jgi:hypothetical protein
MFSHWRENFKSHTDSFEVKNNGITATCWKKATYISRPERQGCSRRHLPDCCPHMCRDQLEPLLLTGGPGSGYSRLCPYLRCWTAFCPVTRMKPLLHRLHDSLARHQLYAFVGSVLILSVHLNRTCMKFIPVAVAAAQDSAALMGFACILEAWTSKRDRATNHSNVSRNCS